MEQLEPVLTMTGRLDPRGGWEARACPIARSVEVVGNRSTFLLLREAFYGTTRFDDFVQRAGVSESIAAARLRSLVEEGLLERRPYQDEGARTRHGYHLTQMGAEFFPVLAALMQWGERWQGPTVVNLRHHECGERVHAALRCDAGHDVDVSGLDLVADDRHPSGLRRRPETNDMAT